MLKVQYFGHLMQRADSLEKIPQCWERWRAGGEGSDQMGWLDGITDSLDMSLSKLGDSEGQESLVYCSLWGHKESDRS